MIKTNNILLPGLDKQISFLKSRVELNDLKILVIGSGSSTVAQSIQKLTGNKVDLIVEDYDSFINTKLELEKNGLISIKMMDFENTDFSDNLFDLVYTQGSISNSRRKKILKEIKRISNKISYLCVGEIIKLNENVPIYVKEVFQVSNLNPINKSDLIPYYEGMDYQLVDSLDLSFTLREYYSRNIELLNGKIGQLKKNEKSYYKKLLNQISHESNTYLKLGGSKFIGFMALLLKR